MKEHQAWESFTTLLQPVLLLLGRLLVREQSSNFTDHYCAIKRAKFVRGKKALALVSLGSWREISIAATLNSSIYSSHDLTPDDLQTRRHQRGTSNSPGIHHLLLHYSDDLLTKRCHLRQNLKRFVSITFSLHLRTSKSNFFFTFDKASNVPIVRARPQTQPTLHKFPKSTKLCCRFRTADLNRPIRSRGPPLTPARGLQIEIGVAPR